MKIYKPIFLALGLLLLLARAPCCRRRKRNCCRPRRHSALSAWVEGDALVAEYKIAPGYYMYRERFDFQIESSDTPARFDVAVIPDGKIKT